MSKKLNIFAFMILLLGQIVLGPMATAYAEGEAPAVAPVEAPVVVQQEVPPPETKPIPPAPVEKTEPEPSLAPPEEKPEPSTPEQVEKTEPPTALESKPTPETSDSSITRTPPGLADSPSNKDQDKDNPLGGTVTVTKKDPTGKPVEGVKFHLTGPGGSGQYDKTVATDANGVAFFNNVHHGKMTLTEIVPTGSTICTENERTFVIADENSGKKHHTFTYVNAPAGMDCQGNVEPTGGPKLGVKKLFEGSNDKDLEAEFKLTSDKGYSKAGVEIDNGETKYFKDLPDGNYTLTETETEEGKGYVLMAPQNFEVKNGEIINGSLDSYNGNKEIVTITNKKKVKPIKPVKVSIVKTFEGGKTKDLKATFTLVCDDYTQSQTTNKDGKATFTDVPANSNCELTETNTPTGYQTVAPLSFETGVKDQTLPAINNKKKTKPVKVSIVKTFEGGKTKDLKATFTLVCDDYTQSQTTNKDGKATFTDVPANSNCELTETNTPTGYQTVAPLSFETGTKDKALDKITNKRTPKAQLIVTKTFENSHDNSLIANFTLVGDNGYSSGNVPITNGKNHSFGGLEPGTYILTEVNENSDNHSKVDPRTFVVDANGSITETTLVSKGYHPLPGSSKLSVKIVNLEIPKTPTATLTVNKTFEHGANQSLLEADFTLTSIGLGYSETQTVKGGESITFANLKPGTYSLTESKTPSGYLPFGIDTFTVKADGTFLHNNSHVYTKSIKNKKKTGSIAITKIDPNKKIFGIPKVLAGAKFKLVNNDTGEQWGDVQETLPVIGTTTFWHVPYGTYRLIEVKAPNGYVINDAYSEENGGFLITINDAVEAPIYVKNYEAETTPTAEITIEKNYQGLDETDFKADFTITGPEEYKQDVSIGGDGHTFGGLIPGDYTISETTSGSPDHDTVGDLTFTVSAENQIVDVTGTSDWVKYDGEAHKFTITNPKNPGEPKGTITIYKTFVGLEEGEVAPEVTINLLNSDKVTVDTAKIVDGIATFTVDYGSYYVEEVPLDGYTTTQDKGDKDKDVPIVIDADNKVDTVAITNTRIEQHGSLEVTKTGTDPDDPNKEKVIPLPGAQFTLMKDNQFYDYGGSNEWGADPFILTTGEDGKFTVSNLPPGEYELREISAPNGYKISDDSSWTITIVAGAQAEQPVFNELRTGTVTLTKTGDQEALLNGAVFDLYRGDPNGAHVRYVEDLTTAGTGDNAGRIVVEGLPIGDYYFVETKAPAGYMLDETPRKFTMTIEGNLLADVPVTNILGKGSAEFIKIDAADMVSEVPTPLKGAVFELWYEAAGTTGFKKIQTVTAEGDDVFHMKDLAFGKYYLVESKAPQYYVLDNKTEYPFEIAEGDGMQDITLNPITNEKGGDIVVKKVDAANTNRTLPGAVFELYRQGETPGSTIGEAIGTETTGDDGLATFKGLPYGKYTIKEIKAPAGYIITTAYTPVELSAEGEVSKTVTITNRRSGGGGGITPTPDPDPDPVDPDPQPETPDPDPDPDPVDPDPQPEGPGTDPDPEDPDPVDPDPQPEGPGTDPDPEDPDPQPEGPDGESVVPQPEKPIKVVEQPRAKVPSKEAKVLPRTGEGMMYELLITGLLAMVLGGWLLFGRRKRKESKQQ
ncbi:SpaA isopeptide-forming pilin-related protein [Sporosarcina sp. FSL K6-1522]|uniref:SpaA isopeptide-forming pilin-related protein n=1 Tax=Sporosarcina sp. FSL K6-1522 TaxID=2921554 RepID=UPI00315A9F0F